MTEFTPVSGLIGGLMIGLSSILMLLGAGRIAGISGIYGGLLTPAKGDLGWRIMFVGGLILGGATWPLLANPLPVDLQVSWPIMLFAGLLVGFGTRLGSGCTSGHGVCGIGRLAPRSMIATLTFMAAAGMTTFVIRHIFGG
ncbi:YeeE/YedE family protein [Nitrosococcus wardiae]|uniref:YeeE/YedE family protein n=1 Tax=Nitrosococcus wardiae TaxID=1814290 RepID=A0A4P7BZ04_9GAMM|nr:YeeE/YedE thiosulfate transporter family protein [Nitrosococcus wardiae]QBQ55433.1 YeeE/YedE family protein [Nitrosococcus wardiae]